MHLPTRCRIWVAGLCLALVSGVSAAADTLGIVVIHGKESQPAFMDQIATSLKGAGHLVEAPEMPWSRRRLYDASFEQALKEVDVAVERLRARGATKIVVSGLSLGGPAVFGYAATRTGIDGLIAWAPAHDPANDPLMRTPAFLDAVARARQQVAMGRGDEVQEFPEINRNTFTVKATPAVWLSYWASDGGISMPTNAARIPQALPVLIVVTPRDPFPQDEDYLLRKTPTHPLSRLLRVDAPHAQVPGASRDQTLAWLQQLLKP